MFDRMHLIFKQVHFFFWQLSRVGGQYATQIRCSYFGSELSWEQCKWRSSPYSSKLPSWRLTVRLFNVISSKLVMGLLDWFYQLAPVDGSHFGCPWYPGQGYGLVCHVIRTYRELQGAVLQDLTLIGGVRFIAWRLRRPILGECRGARGIFGATECAQTHLQKAFCHTHLLGGIEDKYHCGDLAPLQKRFSQCIL